MTVAIVIGGLVVFVIAALAVLGQMSRSGAAPGLRDGHLARCSGRPNCVSSENPDDKKHFIAPLTMPTGGPAAVRQAIEAMDGHVTAEHDGYLAATFKSRIFGFVDDVECRMDPDGVVHVRSSSRVGHSDRDVNRKRIEQLRRRLKP